MGSPTCTDFKTIIRAGMLRNCPVTVEDVDKAKEIYGKDVPSLKGKTTRKREILQL